MNENSVFSGEHFVCGKYTLEYLGMKRHGIYNLHSDDSEKITGECIHIWREKENKKANEAIY